LTGSVREWLPIEELTNVPPSHQNHPQIRLVAADYPTNQRQYAYLRWEVTHPTTPIVWRNSEWLELQHSENTGHPYHTGRRIEVYPTPNEDDEDLATDLTNLQIRNTLAVIDPSGPGSPHHPRSIELRTSSSTNEPTNTPSHNIMSTQTLTTTQTIARTLAGGGGDGEPPSGPSHQAQDPQRIRDVFDIALGRAPHPPGSPGGPNNPGEPGGPPNVPPAHLIPIQPANDLKQAGMPPQVFKGDQTKVEAFMRELRLYMLANHRVSGFESPMRHVAIALTFIKGLKVNGWVEAMLQTLEQLDPAMENVEYMYTNFLNHFQTEYTDSTKQEVTQAALNKHSFCFPFVNQYISDFETLVRKAEYTVGS
jgi:hypothetical protein